MSAISILFPENLRAEIGKRAAQNHRSVGAEIRYLCELALDAERAPLDRTSGQAQGLADFMAGREAAQP